MSIADTATGAGPFVLSIADAVGVQEFCVKYCCCWHGAFCCLSITAVAVGGEMLGGRFALSIAAGRGDVRRVFRFEYCCTAVATL